MHNIANQNLILNANLTKKSRLSTKIQIYEIFKILCNGLLNIYLFNTANTTT